MVEPAAPRRHKVPRSVLVVIHTPALEVLLMERADHPGYWQSVTGAKDSARESYAATAKREVLEETGIEIGSTEVPETALRDWRLANVYDIYPQWQHRYAPGVTRNVERVFGLVVPEGTPVRLAPREHLRWQWLPWRDAAEACFSPSNAEAILHLPSFASA